MQPYTIEYAGLAVTAVSFAIALMIAHEHGAAGGMWLVFLVSGLAGWSIYLYGYIRTQLARSGR